MNTLRDAGGETRIGVDVMQGKDKVKHIKERRVSPDDQRGDAWGIVWGFILAAMALCALILWVQS